MKLRKATTATQNTAETVTLLAALEYSTNEVGLLEGPPYVTVAALLVSKTAGEVAEVAEAPTETGVTSSEAWVLTGAPADAGVSSNTGVEVLLGTLPELGEAASSLSPACGDGALAAGEVAAPEAADGLSKALEDPAARVVPTPGTLDSGRIEPDSGAGIFSVAELIDNRFEELSNPPKETEGVAFAKTVVEPLASEVAAPTAGAELNSKPDAAEIGLATPGRLVMAGTEGFGSVALMPGIRVDTAGADDGAKELSRTDERAAGVGGEAGIKPGGPTLEISTRLDGPTTPESVTGTTTVVVIAGHVGQLETVVINVLILTPV